MSLEQTLMQRSGEKCEICESTNNLAVFNVKNDNRNEEQSSIYICATCSEQIQDPSKAEPNHWRVLNNSMWSEVDAVKVVSYHMLHALKNESWAIELKDQIYLEEDVTEWAKEFHSSMGGESDEEFALDSNGAKLFAGDSVTLIKDLDVKGANFTAKRGTMVKNISLTGDTANIEGKINGTQIVLKTQFLKKAN